jgi:hypothetical protein
MNIWLEIVVFSTLNLIDIPLRGIGIWAICGKYNPHYIRKDPYNGCTGRIIYTACPYDMQRVSAD